MRIFITGGGGFLGKSLVRELSEEHEIFNPSSQELDLINESEVDKYFINKNFDWVIHCAIRGGRRKENDSKIILSENILMYYNLMRNKSKFNGFINFSSGAELDRSTNIEGTNNNPKYYFPKDYYGISKNIISRLSISEKNFFNLRVYGLFGPNESNDRFISTCIRKINNNEKIEIFQDKLFDFFYINDLIFIVKKIIYSDKYINKNNLDIVYKEKYLLSDIAKLIMKKMNVDNEIGIQKQLIGLSYIGKYDLIFDNYNFKGLENGIHSLIQSSS